MHKWISIILFVFSVQVNAQSAVELTGLWVASKVQVGSQEMTPDAKWTRLNSDFTQESGNGWFQHTVGKWTFEDGKLSIIAENGFLDRYGSFDVELEGDQMICKRTEEGEQVIATFERVDKLPQTRRDKLMGLWKPVRIDGEGDFFKEDTNEGDYLFIRWDGKFVVFSEGAKTYGVYNAHAHKSEVELIPYGDSLSRSFWSIEIQEESLEITLLNSLQEVKRKFVRIRQFPN